MPQITKILAIDTETTGFSFGDDPAKNHNMLSCGMIVADIEFNPIESVYVEIKWDGSGIWSEQAQKIHGLTKEHLAQHGLSHPDAAEQIGGLMYEHFGMDSKITLLGTNVMSFDIFFLRKFLNSMEIPFQFSHRALDTFSLAMPTLGAQTSDELFDILGFEKRGHHNALQDAQMSLKSFKIIKGIWDIHVG